MLKLFFAGVGEMYDVLDQPRSRGTVCKQSAPAVGYRPDSGYLEPKPTNAADEDRYYLAVLNDD